MPSSTPNISTCICLVSAIPISAVTISMTLHCLLLWASSTTKLLLKLLNITVKELLDVWACYCRFSNLTKGMDWIRSSQPDFLCLCLPSHRDPAHVSIGAPFCACFGWVDETSGSTKAGQDQLDVMWAAGSNLLFP